MKHLVTALLWAVGLLMLATAAWQFYLFVAFRDSRGVLDAQGGGFKLWLAVGATAVACACVFLGVLRHVNRSWAYHNAP